MKVIIVGAGDLGRQLAATLQKANHDVILMDRHRENLDRAGDKLDIMTVEGSCVSVAAMKEAGIGTADVLLAVSGEEPANILACHIAHKLGVPKTVCRLYDSGSFSDDDDIAPEDLGIWRTIFPAKECAAKICDVLGNEVLLENILFSREEARMVVVEVTKNSVLEKYSCKDIISVNPEVMRCVRFTVILRGTQFIVPHGSTEFRTGDKVYVAGSAGGIRDFLDWVNPPSERKQTKRLIISGSDGTGLILANKAVKMGYEVRIIEPDSKRGEELLDKLENPEKTLVFHGSATEESILDEAGIRASDVFIGASGDDEENILSCILAKRMGVRKVVCLTYKPEYIRIVPSLEMIDCGFSVTLVSVNTILRHLEAGTMRMDAYLQRYRAHLTEYRVSDRSPLCGKKLKDCHLPECLNLSMIFRASDVLIPFGDTVLEAGDVAVVLAKEEEIGEITPLFPER